MPGPASSPGRTTTVPTTTLGRNLRAARLARGMSMRELGRRADVSTTTVQKLEAGSGSAYAWVLYRLARTLNARMEDLLGEPRIEHTSAGRTLDLKRLSRDAGA
jgi:transcriptional regulator with XRE-family HTH domain